MGDIIDYNRRDNRTVAPVGSGGGGYMDDVLKRLSALEAVVAEIRCQVSAITALLPHLATKANVAEVKATVAGLEAKIIKWMIATLLAATAMAFSIAKLVH